MKADLASWWTLLAVAPFGVTGEMRNKYVACLLGDELADDDEFREMSRNQFVSEGMLRGTSCRFEYRGTCFHPFRPGQLAMAIFADCLGGYSTAEKIVPQEEKRLLDCRGCEGCIFKVTEELADSSFGGVSRMYGEMLERAGKGSLYSVPYEKFRSDYAWGIDKNKYFAYGEPLAKFEDNVRRHFDGLMKYHYNSIEAAIRRSYGKVKGDNELCDAIQSVKLDLVTHFMWYWIPEKYKEADYVR